VGKPKVQQSEGGLVTDQPRKNHHEWGKNVLLIKNQGPSGVFGRITWRRFTKTPQLGGCEPKPFENQADQEREEEKWKKGGGVREGVVDLLKHGAQLVDTNQTGAKMSKKKEISLKPQEKKETNEKKKNVVKDLLMLADTERVPTSPQNRKTGKVPNLAYQSSEKGWDSAWISRWRWKRSPEKKRKPKPRSFFRAGN